MTTILDCCYCVFAHFCDFNLKERLGLSRIKFGGDEWKFTNLCTRWLTAYLEMENKVSCISTEGQAGVNAFYFDK